MYVVGMLVFTINKQIIQKGFVICTLQIAWVCGICQDLEFPIKWRVERHLKEQHAGFSYKCMQCKKIFNRRNLQHGCPGITTADMMMFTRDGLRGEDAQK